MPRREDPLRAARDPGTPATRAAAARREREIALVVFDDVQALDAVGPTEVFSVAGRLAAQRHGARRPAYRVRIVARRAGPVRTSAGWELVARSGIRGLRGPLDTLVVAGGTGSRRARRDAHLVGWIRRRAASARRVASVCTGAFLLAEAGLLDGRRAVTHWAACDELASAYPRIQVDPEPIFVRDGRFFTSAGVTAGMDLALALVEEDWGRDLALEVARWLVLFLKRPGGQSQFSVPLSRQVAEREPLAEIQSWIWTHPGADLSVAALARRAGMSPRNFARVFTREVGATPARFVAEARIESARRALEESQLGLDEIARRSGFASAEVMRRAFLRVLRVGPAAYRGRFRAPHAA